MPRSVRVTVVILPAATIALLPAGTTTSEELQRVFVTNFPAVQEVEGSISIKGPIRQAALAAIKEIIVSPVSPKDTQRLIQGGSIQTDGFTNVVLSISGQVKGEIYRAGTVGALLLPDEEPIMKAFEDKGQMQFSLEVAAAGVSGASPYFASNQPRYSLGFPRYRVFFYNTSDKTVNVNLYAYLTN